jgi:folylpolyglutamate synthase
MCTHQERDPQKLLQPLAAALAARRVAIHHAFFVPPDSTYAKLGPSGEPPSLAWQHSLRSVWESVSNGSAAPNGHVAPKPAAQPPALPPPPLVPPPGLPAAAAATSRAAVLPSLGATLEWLRRCVREAPSVRMQVLVTGSLYLVGDMLRALQQPQHGQQAQQGQQQDSNTAR